MKINSPKDINYKRIFKASGQSQTSITNELGVNTSIINDVANYRVFPDLDIFIHIMSICGYEVIIKKVSNKSKESKT